MQLTVLKLMSKNNDIIEDYKKKIGANITKYRKSRNISQKQLADKIGIAPQTLCCIETGINNPSFNVMILIADALELPLAYFFTFDEKTYDINDKELLFLASEAFSELDYDKRKTAFKLIKCFKEEE